MTAASTKLASVILSFKTVALSLHAPGLESGPYPSSSGVFPRSKQTVINNPNHHLLALISCADANYDFAELFLVLISSTVGDVSRETSPTNSSSSRPLI